jgi:hypothetical protein
MSGSNIKWKNRLIVVNTNSKENPCYRKFIHDFKNNRRNMTLRKVILKSYFKYGFKLAPDNFEITIYSIDGRLLKRLHNYTDITQIFSIIDKEVTRMAELIALKYSKTIIVNGA